MLPGLFHKFISKCFCVFVSVMGRLRWKSGQLELELASRKCQLIRIRISFKKAIWLELATKIANWCELRLAAPHVFLLQTVYTTML